MKFAELVDITQLQELCQSFTDATGAVTAILELDGTILSATGWQKICTKFHRICPATEQNCLKSDTLLADQVPEGKEYHLYKCENGLYDAAIPVFVQGEKVARFFTGQFLLEEPDYEYFQKQAEQYGFPVDEYLNALSEVPVYSHKQIASIMGFFSRLARVMGEMGLSQIQLKEINNTLKKAQEDLLQKNEQLAATNEELMATEEELRHNYISLVESEQKLRISESNFREVLENSEVALFKRNFQNNSYDYISPVITAITGYPLPDFLKLSFENFLSKLVSEDAIQYKITLDTCIQSRIENFKSEYRIRTLTGEKIWIHEISTLSFDEYGNPLNSIGSIQDITARKIAEEGLSHATRKLNVLNSTVFMEIMNAVFSLSGYLEIGREYTTDSTLLGFFNTESKILDNLSSIMKFARIFQNLGINPPLRQNVVQIFLFGISHLDMSQYNRVLRVDGLEIFSDPLLEQVFFSLAENVIHHSIHGDEIRLWCKENTDGLILYFEDNGIGIPDNKKSEIFERSDENKGFGLFLVREILSITNISIRESGVYGQGARFEIHVPKGFYWFT